MSTRKLKKWKAEKAFLAAFFVYVAIAATPANAQQSKKVLFVGNSYTYTNNLPAMVASMAASVGDQLIHTSNTPGGCTFQQHCSNQSMTLIQQGGWDAVILQEQSQYPSFPDWQVEAEVFPYATQLVDAIYAASPCAEPMFYMTWGRRDGDQINAAEFPVLGTYEGMDSMLCLRYTQMAADNDASLCPVGLVWRMLRSENPNIELYASDGSHPSLAGTYAAACAFYALLFHHNPAELNYDGGLDRETAATIRQTASRIVWSEEESLPPPQWTRPLPHSAMLVADNTDSVATFINLSSHADSLLWSFGDNSSMVTSSAIDTLMHIYPDTGLYAATLVASRHCMSDTAATEVHISFQTADTTATDTTTVDPLGIEWTGLVSKRNSLFTLYPTVTTDVITIASPSSAPIDITVLSPTGLIIAKKTIDNGRMDCHGTLFGSQLSLCIYPTGVYLLQLRQGTVTETHKVIKR